MNKNISLAIVSSVVLLCACTNKYAGAPSVANLKKEQAHVKTAAANNVDSFHDVKNKQGWSKTNGTWAKQDKQVKLENNQIVLFDFDNSDVSSRTKELVKQYAEWLSQNPNYKVRIEGHTDERGSREYNIALGERRAKSIARLLMLDGVSQDRIKMLSYGKEKPMVQGHNESSWSKNRRGVLTIMKENNDG